jgi:hypothetical protein
MTDETLDTRDRDAPDIRPDNPAFLYPISGRIPDCFAGSGYRISGYCLADRIIYIVFLPIGQEKKFAQKLF